MRGQTKQKQNKNKIKQRHNAIESQAIQRYNVSPDQTHNIVDNS